VGNNFKVARVWHVSRLVSLFVLFLVACGNVSFCQKPSERTQALYEKAKLDEQGGQLDQAVQEYQEIIKLDPKLVYAYNNLGSIFYRQGRFQEAIKSLTHATELDPKLEPARALLGLVFFQMDDFEGARREFKLASQLDPSDSNVKLFLARSLVELKDLRGAVAILERLHDQDPKNTEVLYTLGGVYSVLAYNTIFEIKTVDPNSYLIEVLLGRFAETKQMYQDAAQHYKRAIELSPDVSDLYYRYGHVLSALGDLENALNAFNQALERNPYDYRSEWESARILITDNPEEALRRANSALSLKPDLGDALTTRARALIALHRPQEAVGDLKKAIAADPNDATAHFQLARAYRMSGLTQEAQMEDAIYERIDKEAHNAKEQLLEKAH